MLCLKCLRCLKLYQLLLFWLFVSSHLLWCVNWMTLLKKQINLQCCWCLFKKVKKKTFLAIFRFFLQTLLSCNRYHFTLMMKIEQVFLNNWLSILTRFAKHHIDWNTSLNLCICNLKCVHFICWMISLL